MNELRTRLEDEWDQLVAKIRTSKFYQDAEQQYMALSDRDRILVNILALVFGVFLLWQLVIGPAFGYLNSARDAYAKQLENHEWMQTNAELAREKIAASSGDREGSLLSIASATAKSYDLSFSRFEPIGEDRVRLWMDQVKFNDIVNWLGELETDKGVSAIDISLDSSTPGYVSVRLTLQG